MRKFTKVTLILTACFIGIGLVCILAASALGLRSLSIKDGMLSRLNELEQSLDTRFDRSYDVDFDYSTENGLDVDLSVGESTVTPDRQDPSVKSNGQDQLPDPNGTDSSVKPNEQAQSSDPNGQNQSSNSEYQGLPLKRTFENVKEISIEAGSSVLNIVYGDVDSVELYHNANGVVHAEVEEGELELNCSSISIKGDEIFLVLPRDLQLYELNLELGASVAKVEKIEFLHLDADVGAGELVISAPDEKESYDYDIDCGIGQIVIGDETYTGIVDTQKRNGAQKEMDIDCGAGKVVITFAS